MIENVRGLLDKRFAPYRDLIADRLRGLGYEVRFELLNAADVAYPNRPRVFIIGLRPQYVSAFEMSAEEPRRTTVADALFDLMQSWAGAEWRKIAVGIAPALVGGSKKHGGPDLGPTRARAASAALGVDGRGIADRPPQRILLDIRALPRHSL